MSRTECTTTHTFLAKDGLYYESYESMRRANIRVNEEHLKSKGLMIFKGKGHNASVSNKRGWISVLLSCQVDSVDSTSQDGQYSCPRFVRSRSEPPSDEGPLRRSNRLRHVPPETATSFDSAPKESAEESGLSKSSKPKIGIRSKERDFTAASEMPTIDRRKLANLHAASWLPELENYLLFTEHLSRSNYATTMRQVEKLSAGAGITYHRWRDEGVVFAKNVKVSLDTDLDALYRDAVAFEQEHGRDLGNGWLLRHPIRKLRNFQSYYFENLLVEGK